MMLRSQVDSIIQQIMNGALDDAQAALDQLAPETVVEERIQAHFRAIIAFSRGQIDKAQKMMEEAIEKLGSNVNLLRDLVVCYYHNRDMMSFREGFNRLELLLVEKESSLEEKSLVECETMLGKFMEEEARLAPAFLFYERAIRRATKPEHRRRALIQKARWQALYEPINELSQMYRDLISIPHERINKDMRIELEHSLMLIELRLVGAEHAWQRIERLGPDVAEIDRRLLYFDYVEGCLSQDLHLSDEVRARAHDFKNLDPFESYIFKLLQPMPVDAGQRIDELAELATQLSWSSYLRLLCLTANLESNANAKQELQRKIQLIVRALDPRSQSLWNQRLKQALQPSEIKIEISLRTRSLRVQGKVVDLSKKKIAMQLLEALLGQPSLSVDYAIRTLWQSTFSPEHYHRLRMSSHRLNSLIHEACGQGKIIEVDSQNVRLRPEVKMRCIDDATASDFPGL